MTLRRDENSFPLHRPAGVTHFHGEWKAERPKPSALHDVERYLLRRRIQRPGHVQLGVARPPQPLIEEPIERLATRALHRGAQVVAERRPVAEGRVIDAER